MKMVSQGICLCLGVLFFLLIGLFCPASAWYQDTHEEINAKALELFFERFSSTPKYGNQGLTPQAPVLQGNQFLYLGPEVVSSSKFQNLAWSYHEVQILKNTLEGWVRHGGFSADEPHLWASVRHFYDPLRIAGVSELTDHNWVHGFIYDAVCALEWTFHRRDNPFGWKEALTYYKQSLEVPVDSKMRFVPGISSGVSAFRDPDIPVENPEEARSAYLGKAFRALGETMHLFADMLLPPHVRNDSHPFSDPMEDVVRRNEVLEIFAGVYTEGEMVILPSVGALVDTLSAEEMFDALARFTNENFYSNDTIYDGPLGVYPWNREPPYPSPQFKDLDATLFLGERQILGRMIEGHRIPMIEETYLGSTTRNLPLLSRLPVRAYHIPPRFALLQAAILIPQAAYANARLTDMFFPTLLLSLDAAKKEGEALIFQVTGTLEHLIKEDGEWQAQGMTPIEYAGPGELWLCHHGQQKKLADVVFYQGALDPRYGELLLEVTDDAVRHLTWLVDHAPVAPPFRGVIPIPEGAGVFFVVYAGARKIVAETVIPEALQVKIQGARHVVYETNETVYHPFYALATPEGVYSFQWDFGDGTITPASPLSLGRESRVEHRYEKLGVYHPEVLLFGEKGELLAKDAISLHILERSPGGWHLSEVKNRDGAGPNRPGSASFFEATIEDTSLRGKSIARLDSGEWVEYTFSCSYAPLPTMLAPHQTYTFSASGVFSRYAMSWRFEAAHYIAIDYTSSFDKLVLATSGGFVTEGETEAIRSHSFSVPKPQKERDMLVIDISLGLGRTNENFGTAFLHREYIFRPTLEEN